MTKIKNFIFDLLLCRKGLPEKFNLSSYILPKFDNPCILIIITFFLFHTDNDVLGVQLTNNNIYAFLLEKYDHLFIREIIKKRYFPRYPSELRKEDYLVINSFLRNQKTCLTESSNIKKQVLALPNNVPNIQQAKTKENNAEDPKDLNELSDFIMIEENLEFKANVILGYNFIIYKSLPKVELEFVDQKIFKGKYMMTYSEKDIRIFKWVSSFSFLMTVLVLTCLLVWGIFVIFYCLAS